MRRTSEQALTTLFYGFKVIFAGSKFHYFIGLNLADGFPLVPAIGQTK
jgi:hypothetical protein